MDQILVDSAVRRLKVKNAKNVRLTKKYFLDLCHLISSCVNSAGIYSPGKTDVRTLRNSYEPLYRWMATQLSDLYGFGIDAELLSGAVTTIDLTQGVVEVKVIFAYSRKTYNFAITFNDEGAPYSTEFAALVTKNGGDGNRFAQFLALV